MGVKKLFSCVTVKISPAVAGEGKSSDAGEKKVVFPICAIRKTGGKAGLFQ
ncbi:MAG: hypothetical protein LUG62_05880 [Clostridiales bacterium]|nr:hypothetical protein [Clostridiales bacterium]